MLPARMLKDEATSPSLSHQDWHVLEWEEHLLSVAWRRISSRHIAGTVLGVSTSNSSFEATHVWQLNQKRTTLLLVIFLSVPEIHSLTELPKA